jgi:hypothetical protein
MSGAEVSSLKMMLTIAATVIMIGLAIIGYFIQEGYSRVSDQLEEISKKTRSNEDEILIMKLIMCKYWPEEKPVLFQQRSYKNIEKKDGSLIENPDKPELIFIEPYESVVETRAR